MDSDTLENVGFGFICGLLIALFIVIFGGLDNSFGFANKYCQDFGFETAEDYIFEEKNWQVVCKEKQAETKPKVKLLQLNLQGDWQLIEVPYNKNVTYAIIGWSGSESSEIAEISIAGKVVPKIEVNQTIRVIVDRESFYDKNIKSTTKVTAYDIPKTQYDWRFFPTCDYESKVTPNKIMCCGTLRNGSEKCFDTNINIYAEPKSEVVSIPEKKTPEFYHDGIVELRAKDLRQLSQWFNQSEEKRGLEWGACFYGYSFEERQNYTRFVPKLMVEARSKSATNKGVVLNCEKQVNENFLVGDIHIHHNNNILPSFLDTTTWASAHRAGIYLYKEFHCVLLDNMNVACYDWKGYQLDVEVKNG